MESAQLLEQLVASAESPGQAIDRVLSFLRAELPATRAGVYLVEEGRLEPGPGIAGPDACACIPGGLPLRETALRVACAGELESRQVETGTEIGLPLTTDSSVVGVLVVKRDDPRLPDARALALLSAAGAVLARLV
jgi:putative methionine-R-sulfoxide reductase with GAF domain